MPIPAQWNPKVAIAGLPLLPWEGLVWRGHAHRYSATDPGGSLRVAGRWHRARDVFPAHTTWPALYTAVGLHVCLGEVLRNSADDRVRLFRYTELQMRVSAILDFRDLSAIGVSDADVLDDLDLTISQMLAAAARDLGAEGILVPSASLLGDNLVIFPDRLGPNSAIEIVRSVEPRLVKRRSAD